MRARILKQISGLKIMYSSVMNITYQPHGIQETYAIFGEEKDHLQHKSTDGCVILVNHEQYGSNRFNWLSVKSSCCICHCDNKPSNLIIISSELTYHYFLL